MATHAIYVYRRTGQELRQIHYTAGSLQGCKDRLEKEIRVERYEQDGNEIYVIVNGYREYRIHCVPLG